MKLYKICEEKNAVYMVRETFVGCIAVSNIRIHD